MSLQPESVVVQVFAAHAAVDVVVPVKVDALRAVTLEFLISQFSKLRVSLAHLVHGARYHRLLLLLHAPPIVQLSPLAAHVQQAQQWQVVAHAERVEHFAGNLRFVYEDHVSGAEVHEVVSETIQQPLQRQGTSRDLHALANHVVPVLVA